MPIHNSQSVDKFGADNMRGLTVKNVGTPRTGTDAVNKDYITDTFDSKAAFFQGYLGMELTGRKTMTTESTYHITNDGYALLPTVSGYFHVHAQQLVSSTASAIYLYLRVNGSNFKWAYQTGSLPTNDLSVDAIVYMNGTTNYVDFVLGNTAGTVWNGGHSSVTMFKICD